MNGKEAAQTLELNQPGGPLFMTAENYEYHPAFRKARDLVRKGVIGTIHSLQWNVMNFMQVDNKYNQTRWRSHNKYPGGYVMDGGVHFVHALQMIAGPVVSVAAKTKSINPLLGNMDMGFALMTHESGAVSSINMGWQHSMDKEPIKVFGTEGSLTLKESEILFTPSTGSVTHYDLEEEDTFFGEWNDFYSALTEKRPPEVTQESVVRDVRVIEGIVCSSAEGKEIFI
jgi:predicted dehydrogenase